MYKIARALLFLLEAETAHRISMSVLRGVCGVTLLRRWISRCYTPPATPFTCMGLRFRNRIGLGAGFDKNARYLRELEALGFGHVEIGTVTPRPQSGNEKPRLFRLPADRALVNRMGFNNEGAEAVARRLARWRTSYPESPMIIGGNIGKNKDTPQEEAWSDYLTCFLALHPYVDYFTVNVSSPNTPGLRALQEVESLRTIFRALRSQAVHLNHPRPILLKIAPDLSPEQIDEIASLQRELGFDGWVISNTTVSREGLQTSPEIVKRIGNGGLSGAPLRHRSDEVIRQVRRLTPPEVPILGSGGLFKPSDALEKISSGANLLQVWTGFIYEGPSIVNRLSRALQTP